VRSWGLSIQEQDEVWGRWRQGESLGLIARRLGKRGPSIRAFVLQTGGVRQHPPRRAQRCLSMAEREEISRGVAAGEPCRQIAARLGRAPSTVSRELARNGGRHHDRAQAADAGAFRRAQRPKPAKLLVEPRLRAVVEAKLALRWSPQQIAGWLRLAYPQDPVMRVSHETIYLSLFVQSRGALRRELQRCLRTGRAMRYPRRKRLPQGRGQLRDTVHISQRPAEAADRAVPGHWEGDLVLGRRPSAVGTLVERQSRYVLLFPLPEGVTAHQVRPALTAAVGRLPQQLRRSLTWDQGREMAEHTQFTVDSGVQVYVCDPRSPGSAAPTRTPMGCSANTSPRAPTCASLIRPHSTPSRPNSTVALDKPSASRHPHRHSRRRYADPLRPPPVSDS
jgi:IS30 family transposase